MDNIELQEIDLKILSALKHNARKTYEQVAEEVGLSRTAVKNHIQAMEESGVILGYEVNIQKTGARQVHRFLVDVETAPGDFESTKDYLGQSRLITELYVVSGNCHLHAVGMAPNQATLQAFVNQVQRKLQNARKLSIYAIMSVCKDADGGVDYVREEAQISEE